MMNQNYKKRLLEEVIDFRLKTKGALLIVGPKWCGKTTTAKRFSKSVLNMQDPKNKNQYLALASIGPEELLKGETPRLIDELQIAPALWDAIRQTVDERQLFGQFIMTGSSTPLQLSKTSHTGTGRIVSVLMRPMSLFESLDSTGDLSLRDLFNQQVKQKTFTSPLTFEDIRFLICRGGWPLSIQKDKKIALQQAKDYVKALTQYDIQDIDQVNRSVIRSKAVLKHYARHVSTPAKLTTILMDINESDESSTMTMITMVDYIDAFKKLFVIEEVEAWNPNFRSKTRARSKPIRQFVDPSIAAAALRLSPDDLLGDLHTCGLLFESLCLRDLRIYADALEGNIFHYRDNTNLEIDAIIHLDDGRWGAIEVKLGLSDIPLAVENLKRLVNKMNTDKMKKPSFLMVLTATGIGYQTEDGIWIVPLGNLKN
jgi:predicted AAA+ superfamily ATPase